MTRPGLLQQIESTFGLPPLSRASESLGKFPDTKQLKLVKEILDLADRVSEKAPELDKVLELIREINSVPAEKLIEVNKILKRVEKIMKEAPQDLLDLLLGSLGGEKK